MSRAAGAGRLLSMLLLAFLAIPAAAAANPPLPPFGSPAGISAQFNALLRSQVKPARSRTAFYPQLGLKTPNGYQVDVVGLGDHVIVEVERRSSNAITAYAARGTVKQNRMAASFGRFGNIEMRFRPSSGRSRSERRRVCFGMDRYIERDGMYVGAFRFKGEGGYVSVDARRAKGRVLRVAPQCEGRRSARRAQTAFYPPPETTEDGDLALLDARWRQPTATVWFAAIEREGRARFLTWAEQGEGRMAIFRYAVGVASASAFTIDNALTVARVSPPAPFHGAGTYRAAPDGTTTWAGTLAVNFPGAGRFPLAGPPFKAVVDAGF
jgi:hypothetical protein